MARSGAPKRGKEFAMAQRAAAEQMCAAEQHAAEGEKLRKLKRLAECLRSEAECLRSAEACLRSPR